MKLRIAGTVLLAGMAAFSLHAAAAPAGGTDPVPIPGGIQIPGGPLIHVFAPGPPDLGLMGLDVEPGVITDFTGFSALAYLAGTATDAGGNAFDMLNDMRVYRGEYVTADGTRLRGTFGFV